MENNTGLTAADVGAIVNPRMGYGCYDGGFGGDSWAWIILVILLGGFGGFGYGRGNNDYITSAQFESANQYQSLDRQLSGITYGLADSTFALNNSITSEGRALQTQLSQCCCENKQLTLENRYLAAQNTAAINANTTAQTQKILDKLCENEITTLRDKVGALELQAAVANVVRYPNGFTYSTNCNPFCGTPCGCNGNI